MNKKHYHGEYVSRARFSSYFSQIDAIIKKNPRSILEIGVGNKIVYNYLKHCGYAVTGYDIDKKLKPDKVGDVRKLSFKDDSFDIVVAFEILEHIPFEAVEGALKEIQRVTKKNAIISVPHSCASMEFITSVDIPLIHKMIRMIFKVPYFSFTVEIGKKGNEEHYWELGRKGYSKKRFKKLLKKYFYIKKEFSPHLNPFHCFFVLNKKN